MNHLPGDVLVALLADQEPPCLSLYQPTHRSHPDNAQDVIRYGNLLKEMELSLQQKFRGKDTRAMMEPFHALERNTEFWNHALDGLAVFGGSGRFEVFKLQRPVPELAIVADSFHLKPLLRIYQSTDRYQVLVLNRDGVKLFEGNRDMLDEVALSADVPQAMQDVTGEIDAQPDTLVHGTVPGRGSVVHTGRGAKTDVIDTETEKFFRAVDRAILEHYSKPSGLPLMLAALPQYHALFHRVSHNPFLMKEGIEINADAIDADALRARAWQTVEPDYAADLVQLGEQFHNARAKGQSNDDLSDVAAAAVHGRVETLLVEAERHIPGRMEAATARIAFDELAHPEIDDLLDDVAEEVLKKGGNVLVVPKARMPTQSGLAAIYRF
ncbi:hypothetical protein D3870_16950 [Noviherbaspirillum cavernae]|uniref:Uncharacterized protein n=1 Tax=Noviherbaspirillum cavernae TaxID=2320862 RepID=A0A418X6Q9_9BURK|nr:hypothetical protein [Noviherbaspirillum cavernae]RJG08150.1 hypothetical protein D3870_16950 [Noviherbaspirillum cavernae]